VFQNLIDNAIKYMGDGSAPEGGPAAERVKAIHVGCAVRGDEAEFYVRDTGIGIEPEDRNKIFYVFRRGKGAAVQNVAGKGVGLASVKSIVETYNGSIWVESTPGSGSTFKFTVNGQYVLASPPTGSSPAAGASGQGKAA
jgi:signal transduction histidine kinase